MSEKSEGDQTRSRPKYQYSDFEWGLADRSNLGMGSFAEVRLARLTAEAKTKHNRENNCENAVKIVNKNFLVREKQRTGKDVIAQAFRERNILCKLDSPFIVKLIGTFQTTNDMFYVLSYEDMGDLRELLNDKSAIEYRASRFYIAEVFSALFYLHKKDIIHRDMKPENVLLGRRGESGIHAKLCDFATARDVSELKEGERARTFVGSALYVSPELLIDSPEHGGKYTCFESDLWAAAVMLYFMMSGAPPWGELSTLSEYQVFMKIEKLDYAFPETFHRKGRDLITEILKLNPLDRLGANLKNDQIKEHEFFKGLDWTNLDKQKPPVIEQYFLPCDDPIEFGNNHIAAAFSELSTSSSTPKLDTSERSEIDSPHGLGYSLTMEKDEYEKLLKDQILNRQNRANRWNTMAEGELIIKMGYLDKKRGLFSRKRMFLLTGGRLDKPPRLIYIDAEGAIFVKKGEIKFTPRFKIVLKTFSRFYIIDPDNGRTERTYDLTDKTKNAKKWCEKLEQVMRIFFSDNDNK